MDNLASSLSGLLSILGALGNVGVPYLFEWRFPLHRGPGVDVPDDLTALFLFIVSKEAQHFCPGSSLHFSLPRTPQELFLYSAPTTAVMVHKSNINNPSLPLV